MDSSPARLPGTAVIVGPLRPADELERPSAQGGSDADACACQGTAGRAGPPAGPASSVQDHQAGLPPALTWLCHMALTAVTVLAGMFTYWSAVAFDLADAFVYAQLKNLNIVLMVV